MGSLRFLALFVLLLSLSLVVFADISNDATHANDEAKPSEATDGIEPQQRGQPQAAEAEANDAVVDPQQRWGGGCWYGCCGGWYFGRCRYCCRRPQAVEAEATEANEVVEAVEPQQGRGGGGGGGGGYCRYGCCGGWRFGRCRYCCRRPQDVEAKAVEEANEVVEAVEPQQRGRGCRYCCGAYAYGQCSACCSKKMFTEMEKKKEEAKP